MGCREGKRVLIANWFVGLGFFFLKVARRAGKKKNKPPNKQNNNKPTENKSKTAETTNFKRKPLFTIKKKNNIDPGIYPRRL